MTIRAVRFSGAAFQPILDAAEGEGAAFIARLAQEWRSGAMRFEADGEILLGAYENGALVGIAGISRDPYAPEPGLGRVRHVYVLPAWRGRGLGRSLVTALLTHARAGFAVVRLNTRNPVAARLYESLGFERSNAAERETHRLTFGEEGGRGRR